MSVRPSVEETRAAAAPQPRTRFHRSRIWNRLRIWHRSRDTVFSLEVLASSPEGEPEQPAQFRVLVRHFLERFFSSEPASADGDAKTRLVQAACAIGVLPLVAALYLYPVYHIAHRVRPYWAQVGDRYFFVLYSMAAMGIVTICEWDLLFPDLLDVFVFSSLPVRNGRVFRARVTAIFLLLGAALFDANFLAPVVLPAATDPANLPRFLAGHLLAVAASGIFGAVFFLGLEGLLLGWMGERWFRRVSLWLQGLSVFLLLTLLFLYPALSGALASVLESGSRWVLWVPPFWFLGIEQHILDGPAALPVFIRLAHIGAMALATATGLAVATYPIAWWRRTRSLVEGGVRRQRHNRLILPAHSAVHGTVARAPAARGIWHFIGQNLLRVPRYRMVLVLYGGAGAALVFASVVRVSLVHGEVGFVFSPLGLRATVPVVAFWTVSGLRSTFLATADQRGRWIFRVIVGKPGHEALRTAQRWVLLWSLALSLAAGAGAIAGDPPSFAGARACATQILVAVALCVLLTDSFFLNVKTIPFTGPRPEAATNFALLLIPYLGFFPVIVLFTVGVQASMEGSWFRIAIATVAAITAHLGLRTLQRIRIAEHLRQIEADDDQEDFPLRLGLRY